ncbi:MAG: condensation domain-containing protein, partial [Pyrinomonadaceae bacterium]
MSKNKKIEAIYQLSPLQRGILFHTAYAPESGLYFEQVLLVIEGDLNTATFERAWQETATRQDVLRTFFVWEGQEKPLQVVVEQVKLPFEQDDWRQLTGPEQRVRLETFLEEDRRRGFDLTKLPLMRLFLIRVEDQRYQLVLSFQHLLLDGWSMWLLLGEVFACYEASCKNEPFKLEKLLSYGDYIDWLQKQDLSVAEEYWRQTLTGFTTPTRLRVENGFQASAGVDYLEEELHLPEETTTSLLSLARTNKLTLSTLVQGAWALLLSRWSGERDVVYGVVVSGRPASLPGAESIVGLFINSLPMRAKLSWDHSVVSWLRSLQDQMAEMSQYEYSPLVDIQGWTEVPRGVQLFDTLFAFENYPMEARSLGGVAGLKVQFTRAVEKTNYSITVLAVPGAGLTLKIIYHSGRFNKDIVRRLLSGLEALLEGMTVDPDSRLYELPFLTEAERNQLLVDWNDTHTSFSNRRGVHELFEQQAERNADAVALVCGQRRISYGELNRKANQVAHYLKCLGVGPESVVGICVEHSIQMMVGLFGILKAGGAYLPLDPSSSKEQLSFMLEDSAARVVLTDRQLLGRLPESCGKTVCLDDEREAIARMSEQNPPWEIDVENIAHIIYSTGYSTGSSGKPAGIAIEHRCTINFLNWASQDFVQRLMAGVLASTTIHLGHSIFELFAPLSFGGTVTIAESVTYKNATVEEIYNLALINPENLGSRSTGRPIANTRIYVLDEQMQPVPVGVTGEIYIAGEGLARGYLNRS